MRFECKKCSYVTDKKEPPKRCPYCGEADTMTRAKDAQDFLNESISEN